MNKKSLGKAFAGAFGYSNGVFHGEGVEMAAYLKQFCTTGTSAETLPRDKNGKVDETALAIAIGRRQVWDEIYSLIAE